MKNFKNYLLIGLAGSSLIFTSCGDDDTPGGANDPEVITNVNLVFTNTADASDVVRARAEDPDDLGVDPLAVLDTISLKVGTTYTLTYEILNELAEDPEERDVIAADISNELDEHQVFYAWTNGLFASPTGNGNILASEDDLPTTIIGDGGSVDYQDTDDGDLPVGLETEWTTADTPVTEGAFRVLLKHQPDGQKTANSDSNTADTDFNLTFVINVTE